MAKIDPASPKVGGNRFSPEARKLAREREAKVLELRLRKVPFERIAEALGITKGAANKAFYRALRRIPAAFADQVRKEELESLERMEARVWREVDQSGQKAPLRFIRASIDCSPSRIGVRGYWDSIHQLKLLCEMVRAIKRTRLKDAGKCSTD